MAVSYLTADQQQKVCMCSVWLYAKVFKVGLCTALLFSDNDNAPQ